MSQEPQPSTSKTANPKKKLQKPVASAETHPPTSKMVDAALKAMNERKGSSLIAIKKYLGVHYKVDPEKMAPFIKRYLKKAIEEGKILQTKGTGASGSFKMSSQAKPKKKSEGDASKKKSAGDVAKKPKTVKPRVSVAATPAFKKRASIAAKLKPKKLKLARQKEPSVQTNEDGSPEKKMRIKSPKKNQVGKENKKPKAAKSPQKSLKKAKSPMKVAKSPKKTKTKAKK